MADESLNQPSHDSLRSLASSNSLEALLTRTWRSRGWLACLLWPLSLIFLIIIRVRYGLYVSGLWVQHRMPVPVIVVGNIYVGGTGKTPLVIWLVEQLRRQGFVPGVISRGHGTDAGQVLEVLSSHSTHEAGDEPLLIVRNTGVPLVIGRNRVAAARALLKAHAEINVIISDDGLQHYALARNIEILLSDERGVGNGWLLPAGPLREPASRRWDFRVLHGVEATDEQSFSMQLYGQHAEQLLDRGQVRELAGFSHDARIAAAAGIGNPGRFFEMLRLRGVNLCHTLALPDHFDFSGNPFEGLEADIILITEKDAVKCMQEERFAHDSRLWVVPVQAAIAGPLSEQLVEKLRGHPTA